MEDVWDGITHVIRGDDHISNTPKQINIIRAVGAEVPVYAHAPSIFGSDGKKLSKRHGATGVAEFRASGYVPEAIVNFLALLGWAPDGETTIMSRDELVERFSLEKVTLEPGDVRLRQARLDERRLPARDERGGVRQGAPTLARRAGLRLRDPALVRTGPRCRSLQVKLARLERDSPDYVRFLFEDVAPDPALLDGDGPETLTAAAQALAEVEPFDVTGIEAALRATAERLGLKPRQACSSRSASPSRARRSPQALFEEPGAARAGRSR